MSKEYKVRSLDDLCNLVNENNYETLAEDVKTWLISYHLTIESIRKTHPKQTQGKTNTEIAKGGFTWIDDGKNDVLGMTIESDGKEKIKVDFKKEENE